MHARAIGAAAVSAGLLTLTSCGGSSSSPPPPPASVGIVADSGFRPGPNGFSFENYGQALSDGTVPTNLTPAQVRALFGDAVCADASIGKCDLIPEAQAWMDQMNYEMANGHCFGFSVAADLVWQNQVNTSSFGAPTISKLTIARNATLQSTIARGWVYQTLSSVQGKKISGSPNKILGDLKSLLKPHPADTYTLTIWKRDGTAGHAVTPYEVDYKGSGQYAVLIYDNNWPGESRAIAFDTNKDSWSYDAASNPGDPSERYEGDADSKTMELLPTSPGQGVQPCPFCRKVSTSGSRAGTTGAARTATIYLTGGVANHSHVLITDQAGRHLGYLNGRLVNQIPGAHYLVITSDQVWKNKLEPILFVPADVGYTITLDGTALTAPDTESIRIIGPSWHIAINDIPMGPGDKDTLVADPNATTLTYHTTRAESPTIQAAVSDTRASYAFVIAGVSSEPGSTINLHVPAKGRTLIISNVGSPGLSSVDLAMTRYTEQGLQHFTHHNIRLIGGDTAELQFGNWTAPDQSIPLVTTHNGQRTTETLANQ